MRGSRIIRRITWAEMSRTVQKKEDAPARRPMISRMTGFLMPYASPDKHCFDQALRKVFRPALIFRYGLVFLSDASGEKMKKMW